MLLAFVNREIIIDCIGLRVDIVSCTLHQDTNEDFAAAGNGHFTHLRVHLMICTWWFTGPFVN